MQRRIALRQLTNDTYCTVPFLEKILRYLEIIYTWKKDDFLIFLILLFWACELLFGPWLSLISRKMESLKGVRVAVRKRLMNLVWTEKAVDDLSSRDFGPKLSSNLHLKNWQWKRDEIEGVAENVADVILIDALFLNSEILFHPSLVFLFSWVNQNFPVLTEPNSN